MNASIAPHNQALLDVLHRDGARTKAGLFSCCAKSGETTLQFGKRLQYLRAKGLIASQRCGDVVFWVAAVPSGPSIPSAPACAEAMPSRVARLTVPAGVVPPRRVDVMNGPVYRPEPVAPVRAGARAHEAAPSMVQGQLRAYWSRSA